MQDFDDLVDNILKHRLPVSQKAEVWMKRLSSPTSFSVSVIFNHIQNSQKRFAIPVGMVWLTVSIALGVSLLYLAPSLWTQGLTLFIVGIGIAAWLMTHSFKPQVPRPTPHRQARLETLEPHKVSPLTEAAGQTDRHLDQASQKRKPSPHIVVDHKWSIQDLEKISQRFNQSTSAKFEGIIIHKKFRILDVNQTLATMFGYQAPELIGGTILELIAPEARSIVLRNTMVKYEQPYEAVGLKKDGSTLVIEIVSKAISYQEYPLRVMGMRAITLKQTEAVLEDIRQTKAELNEEIPENIIELKYANERLRLELDERLRMETEIKAHARQQAAVAELGQRALGGADLITLMDEAASIAAKTLEVEYSQIFELIPENNTLLLRAGIGWQPELIGHFTMEARPDSQAGYTLHSKGPITVNDFRTETRFSETTLLQEHQVISGLSVIIQGRSQPFGVLGIHSTTLRDFTKDDIHFLQAVANVLAMAIERKQSETQIIQRNRQLLTLQSAGIAITSNLDLQYVLNTVTREMSNLLGVETCTLSTWDQTSDTVSLLATHSPDDWLDQKTTDDVFPLKDYPLAAQTLKERTALQIAVDQTDLTPAERNYLQAAQVKTLLMLPMIFQERVVGLVEIMDRAKRAFSDQETALAQLLANQAASAIENARLFEQTQAALNETEALYRVAHALAQMDDEPEMFEFVLTEYLAQLNLRQGGVLIIDENKTPGPLQAFVKDGQIIDVDLQIPIAGHPSLDKSLTRGEPVVIKDVLNDSLLEPAHELNAQLGIKSLLIVPIMAHGEVIGMLGSDATEITRDFTDRELSLAKAMANQLGIAIENKNLHAEMERRTLQLAVLHELDRAVTSSLHLNDIFHAFAHHAVRLLAYDWMSITLMTEGDIRIVYVIDEYADKNVLSSGTTLPRQGSAVGWVVTQGQPLVRHNIEADTRYAEDEQLVKLGLQSVMVIPLRVKGQVIGTWNIGRQQVGAFSPDDMEIGQSMADQLAITIENARLYNEVHQYLDELHTLNMISQAINSTLDLQKILTLITGHTIRLLEVEAASVILYDKTDNNLWFAAASGGGSDEVRGMELESGQGIVGWVVEHGQPALVPDVSQDPRFFNQIDQNSNFTTRSILCVPLKTKGQTIGAIEAINKEKENFTQEDLRLLTSLVAPAATAIENARLFEHGQQELAERQRAETALEKERALLARRVAERTADLSAANAELARAARLKDEFLASMSHELRTPLTAILGLADVLKLEVYGPLTEKQIKSVEGIEESGHHLLELINDILDLSKIEADKLELDIGPVSVQSACQASLQFIKQSANKKKLKIFSTYDEAVTILMADERRLKQILVNLLSNAVKFTPEGGRIGLEVLGDSERQTVDFVVWDTGIGIAPEHMKHLFQPFVQLDSSLSRQYTGTGLGLALVRRMAEMHGGGISVESEVDKGSRFTISLPLHGLTPGGEETDAPGQAAPNLSDISRALIIEDSVTVTNQLTYYLDRLGVELVAHSRGPDAIDKVFEVMPDVIILDILLPGSSGWEILAQLKAEPQTEQIPVLIVSVVDEPAQGLALGAAEYLVKPITQRQLYEALKRIIAAGAEATEPSKSTIQTDENRAPDQTTAPDTPLILLAEDQDKISEFIVDYIISKKGYRVITARDGLEALERARTEQPDLILMDIQMPEMDGLQAIGQLKVDANLASVPIIALTALAMPGDRERCLEAGADSYLSKPINLRELSKLIDTHLDRIG